MPRYDSDWIEQMLRPERRGSPPAEETLADLGLAPGQTVVDVGCGPGFFTLPAATLVAPNGLVCAIDLEPAMLDLVRSRAEAAGIPGIEVRRGDGQRLPLDDAVVDVTVCSLVLHDLDDRLALVREMIRATRPGGRIAVVEWLPEQDDRRPNRMRPEEVTALFTRAGEPAHAVTPLGTSQYLVVVTRTESTREG
ncbi:MAG TPA: methyltransferase domain-containing protein [Chloroflexota bacterium]|nr:methyltransferase domain-containing protein [Chloroflexota bacterium]